MRAIKAGGVFPGLFSFTPGTASAFGTMVMPRSPNSFCSDRSSRPENSTGNQQETTITKDTRKSPSAKAPLICGKTPRTHPCVNAGCQPTSIY